MRSASASVLDSSPVLLAQRAIPAGRGRGALRADRDVERPGQRLVRGAERRAGAGSDRQRSFAYLEDVSGDALHQAADEGIEVTGVATLDEHAR